MAIFGAAALAGHDKVFANILPFDSLALTGPSQLTSDRFMPFVNTMFQIREPNSGNNAMLRLIQVKKIKHTVNSEKGFKGESFSLLFHKGRQKPIQEGIHVFSHDSLEEFSFFISPVTPDPNHYEVIVDQLAR